MHKGGNMCLSECATRMQHSISGSGVHVRVCKCLGMCPGIVM